MSEPGGHPSANPNGGVSAASGNDSLSSSMSSSTGSSTVNTKIGISGEYGQSISSNSNAASNAATTTPASSETPATAGLADYRATGEAHKAAMAARIASLKGDICGATVDDRVKRRLEQLESMLSKVQARIKDFEAATNKEGALKDIDGFTVKLEQEQAVALKEAEALLAGKYLNIFGDLYYTSLETPIEDSIGITGAQSWNHLGLQSLNQFIINYNINTRLGDDLALTLEVFLRHFSGNKKAVPAPAAAPVAAPANTPAAPECSLEDLRYLLPPLRYRMLTLRSQARLFTLNAGAGAHVLTPNAHHYLDVAERISKFIQDKTTQCNTTWEAMAAKHKQVVKVPEPPTPLVDADMMRQIKEIHEMLTAMKADKAAAAPVATQPSEADLVREYLMTRFLEYEMLREDARAWLNKKILKAQMAARFDALEERLGAQDAAGAAAIEEIERKLQEILTEGATGAELHAELGALRADIGNMMGQLDAEIKGEIREGVYAVLNKVEVIADEQAKHIEEIANEMEELHKQTQDLITRSAADTAAGLAGIAAAIDDIHRNLEALNAQREANQAHIADLALQLDAADAERRRLAAENEQLIATNTQLRATLTAATDRAAALGVEVERLQAELQRLNELEARIAELTASLAAANADKDNANDRIRQLEGDVERLTGELAECQRGKETTEAACQDLNAQIQGLSGELAAAHTALATSQGREAELQAQMDALRTAHIAALETLRAEITALQGQLAAQTAAAAAATAERDTRIGELTAALTRAQGDLADLQTRFNTNNAALADANTRITTLEKYLAAARDEKAALQARIAALGDAEGRATQADTAAAEATTRADEAEARARAAEERARAAAESKTASNGERDAAREAAEAARREAEAARAEQATAEEQLRAARAELADLSERQTTAETENRRLGERIAALEAEKAKLARDKETIERQLKLASDERNAARAGQEELASLRARQAEITRRATEIDARYEETMRLRRIIQKLVDDITAAASSIKSTASGGILNTEVENIFKNYRNARGLSEFTPTSTIKHDISTISDEDMYLLTIEINKNKNILGGAPNQYIYSTFTASEIGSINLFKILYETEALGARPDGSFSVKDNNEKLYNMIINILLTVAFRARAVYQHYTSRVRYERQFGKTMAMEYASKTLADNRLIPRTDYKIGSMTFKYE